MRRFDESGGEGDVSSNNLRLELKGVEYGQRYLRLVRQCPPASPWEPDKSTTIKDMRPLLRCLKPS